MDAVQRLTSALVHSTAQIRAHPAKNPQKAQMTTTVSAWPQPWVQMWSSSRMSQIGLVLWRIFMATAADLAAAALDRFLDARDGGSTIEVTTKFAAFDHLGDPDGPGNNAQHEHADAAEGPEDAGHYQPGQDRDDPVRDNVDVPYGGLPWAVHP